jgi:cell division cycle 14
VRLGWYSFKDFDPREYEYYEKVENGDLNWVLPGKFIAFMGPVEQRSSRDLHSAHQRHGNSPEDYLEVFKHFGVTHVVRLNEPSQYDRSRFTKNGIKHSELYFIDGSTPSDVRSHRLDLNDSSIVNPA